MKIAFKKVYSADLPNITERIKRKKEEDNS